MVQLRTEVAQLRSSAEAERTTFMAAIENKNRELNTEMAEKESAKAALDEVTKSLMLLQDDIHTSYITLSSHQELLSRATEQEDRMHKELSSVREKLETYSKEAVEAKNICSMQQILINEKDRELKDKEKELRSMRRDLDGKSEALSSANAQLQQSARERDRDHERIRGEMMNMSLRQESPTRSDSINYKTMFDELRLDKEREKATSDQLIERLKWEISTLEERLQSAKADLQDKVKLETNYLLSQGEADRFRQEAGDLARKATRLEERVEHLQRETERFKDTKVEVDVTNQSLRDENMRVREENSSLKSQLESMQRELSGYSVTREEMEAALATAKLTTDVNDMTRQENDNEVQLERKHKMVLYRQAKSLRTEINEKNVRLRDLERTSEKLKAKVLKLKAENNALTIRLKDRISVDSQRAWDVNTGLTQADVYQEEVKQLQSQLESTNDNMEAQARKAKLRKQDISYFQGKAEDLERKNRQLSVKLNDSQLMVEAAERTAADLRNHVAQLTQRLRQYDELEGSAEMAMDELRTSGKKENRDLEREINHLKRRLSLAEYDRSTGRSSPRSRSASPTCNHPRSKRSHNRYSGEPLTDYEKDRRSLTRAAWAVLDDHGMGPPADQRVFENLDRIWRRNASRPTRYL
ncbi:coiled-coil domain-containing protein 158-like [Watersipora subatra]|uniref:coiled-coil domain-containing protein 158-like n=1 Tax=Watersipora subatra TaxID=2589382 RepID=UPI00355BCFCF